MSKTLGKRKGHAWREIIDADVKNKFFLDQIQKEKQEEFKRLLRLRRSEEKELELPVDVFMERNKRL